MSLFSFLKKSDNGEKALSAIKAEFEILHPSPLPTPEWYKLFNAFADFSCKVDYNDIVVITMSRNKADILIEEDFLNWVALNKNRCLIHCCKVKIGNVDGILFESEKEINSRYGYYL